MTYRGRHSGGGAARSRFRWVALLVVLGWLVIGGVGGPLVGRLAEVQKNDDSSFLPAKAESTTVLNAVRAFSPTQSLPFIVVVERPSGITAADKERTAAFTQSAADLALPGLGGDHRLGEYAVGDPVGPVPSEDGKALLVIINVDADKADNAVNGTTALDETVVAIKGAVTKDLRSAGLTAYLTGPGGTIGDFVEVFQGIDGLLLLVAVSVVFVILLVVYRSPILPLVVLVGAIFGLAVAGAVIFPLAKSGSITLSGQSQGILFILVVGAATDYSLLLVARFKEELHDETSTWAAMKRAWRGSVEPIVASGATVVLGLLCLLFASLESTRGLGPVGAIGIAGAVASALTFLPAVLLLIGRRVFWPVVPRVDHQHSADAVGTRGLWGRVAGVVGRHPRRTWALTLLCLLVAAAFLPTFKASGVSQTDTFLAKVDSVQGEKVLARHFPAGSGSPLQVIAPEASAAAVLARLERTDGVKDPYAGLTPGRPARAVDGRVLLQATLSEAADSPAATRVVKQLRTDLRTISPKVLVGGDTATQLDVLDASDRDLKVIIPTILVVIFVVLSLLLRSLLAPLLLVVANIVSFAATIGIAAVVFNHVLDFPGADPSTPLYGFVFLVALGIDYSIFLMTRVREESAARGTRPGILVALTVTGGVITSAGVVLASTFSALAVLPLLFLAQIAFIVAFGVLLDTLVVRSLLVPSLSHDLGFRIWWPSRLDRGERAVENSTG